MISVPLHNSSRKATGKQVAWRELVRNLLPEMWELAKHNDATTYSFFTELRDQVQLAHKQGNENFLFRAYAFVYWSFDHPSKDLWNPVGVCFLEHLFENGMYEQAAPWLRSDMLKEAVELDVYIHNASNVSSMDQKPINKQQLPSQVAHSLATHLEKMVIH
jgi:hypothetical protein